MALDADLLESCGDVHGAARLVVAEDAAGELAEACSSAATHSARRSTTPSPRPAPHAQRRIRRVADAVVDQGSDEASHARRRARRRPRRRRDTAAARRRTPRSRQPCAGASRTSPRDPRSPRCRSWRSPPRRQRRRAEQSPSPQSYLAGHCNACAGARPSGNDDDDDGPPLRHRHARRAGGRTHIPSHADRQLERTRRGAERRLPARGLPQRTRERDAAADPVVVSATYLRPAARGPARLRTELVRAGRRVATGEVRLLQDGREIVRAVATFADLDTAAGRTMMRSAPPVCPRRSRRTM